MLTNALRLYGADDLRLEQFELPSIKPDEILAHIICDSLCMSSYKAVCMGASHRRIPNDVAKRPIVLGHEFCGEIVAIGSKWKQHFSKGQSFVIQPSLNWKGTLDAPGYSFPYIGGNATYVVIPHQVMEMGCLLPYDGEGFFQGSLTEPYSCVIGALRANYRVAPGTHRHDMGIQCEGQMAIIGGTGPMGMAMIDYTLHGDQRPSTLVVSGRNDESLQRVAHRFPPAEAKKQGINLIYLNTATDGDPYQALRAVSKFYNDIFVMVADETVVEYADRLLAPNGCLNFFAGPSNQNFRPRLNFFAQHYGPHHFSSVSGGTTDDLRSALRLFTEGALNPATLITHVGGLSAAGHTTMHLPDLPNGKKLIYTNIDLPLFALQDLPAMANDNKLYAELADIVGTNQGMWSVDAERYLLAYAPVIR